MRVTPLVLSFYMAVGSLAFAQEQEPTPAPTSALPDGVVIPGATPEPSEAPGTIEPHTRVISVIVVDPGHGGDDAGVTAGGTTEKDLTMAIARRIESKVSADTGVHVLLTRGGDVRVTAGDRASLANQSHASLFLSIHADGSPTPSARGFRVWYHDPADDVPAPTPAPDGSKQTPWSAAQRPVEAMSARFAEALHDALAEKLTLPDRGVRRIPLATLEGATCPAAWIDVGYLTNPDDALALSTDAVQDAIAEAVGEAVLRMDAVMAESENK